MSTTRREIQVDRVGAQRWLERYIEAWRSNDRHQIADLFSEDVAYRYHPYDQPIVGRGELVGSWLESPDDPGSWDATYAPFALEGERLVAVGTSRYHRTEEHPERIFHNVFLIVFEHDGRCREFTEYYVQAR